MPEPRRPFEIFIQIGVRLANSGTNSKLFLGKRNYRLFFRVRAAFLAALDRAAGPRRRATLRPCVDNRRLDAAERPSFRNARLVARDRLRDGRFPFLRPLARSRLACLLVLFEPCAGGGNLTPARRALESPMAMACSGDRAPCSPDRICSISSRTNSPACVDGE